MTWLAFVASMTSSLAWPIVIAVLALRFRDHLATVLRRLTKAKGFGGELEFGQGLDKVEKLAPPSSEGPKLDAKPRETNVPTSNPDDDGAARPSEVVRLRADTTTFFPPEYRIISAWKSLYSAISDAALEKGLSVKGFLGKREISAIGQAIGLSPERIQQVNQLRDLRNRAANEPDWTITITDALRYEDLVLTILAQIESKKGEAKPNP